MNAKTTYLIILFVILFVSIGSTIIGPSFDIAVPIKVDKLEKKTENFLSPGDYPLAVKSPLLYDTYKPKDNPGLSGYSSYDIISDYPMFPAGSCLNNNVRYWRRPNNGTCSPADFCDGIYETTEPNIPSALEPPKDTGVRVNYYDSLN